MNPSTAQPAQQKCQLSLACPCQVPQPSAVWCPIPGLMRCGWQKRQRTVQVSLGHSHQSNAQTVISAKSRGKLTAQGTTSILKSTSRLSGSHCMVMRHWAKCLVPPALHGCGSLFQGCWGPDYHHRDHNPSLW